MSLMVVVSSCLYTALYTGFRAYQTAQTAVDPTLAAVNAIEVIKQDLRGVLPPGSSSGRLLHRHRRLRHQGSG